MANPQGQLPIEIITNPHPYLTAQEYRDITGEIPIITTDKDPALEAAVTHWQNCRLCQAGVPCVEYGALMAQASQPER
ncbi:MAG: hypothetical protein H0X24_11825 [Ktedonobacterales bacterium]|nr:hypothetical protein [Ktedonobacterales bacterium]